MKTEEIPYDFVRKRLSIAVQDTQRDSGAPRSATYPLITKGALDKVLEACTQVYEEDKTAPLDESQRRALQERFAGWSDQGFRVLGVATKEVPPQPEYPVGRA